MNNNEEKKELYFVTAEEVYNKIKQLRKNDKIEESEEIGQETEEVDETEKKEEFDEKDEKLLFVSERSIEMVKAYCCIEEVPRELKNVCVEIAIMLLDNGSYAQKGENTAIKSIQEGNVSVTYQSETSNWKEYKKVLLEPFQEELNQFRKMRW